MTFPPIRPRIFGPILCLDLPVPRPQPPAHERLELRYGMTDVYDGPTGRHLGTFDTGFRCEAWLAGRPPGSWYRLVRHLPQTLTFDLTLRTIFIASVHYQGVIIRQVRNAWTVVLETKNPPRIKPSRGEHEPQ